MLGKLRIETFQITLCIVCTPTFQRLPLPLARKCGINFLQIVISGSEIVKTIYVSRKNIFLYFLKQRQDKISFKSYIVILNHRTNSTANWANQSGLYCACKMAPQGNNFK